MKGYIYKISNSYNDKLYVGKTTENPKKYWNMHKNRASNGWNKLLYSAMRKYGIENFDFSILEVVIDDNKSSLNSNLNNLEIVYIDKLNALAPNGYNLTLGGEGTSGTVRDEAFKENLRKLKTGVVRPQWVKDKLKKPKSESHKLKLRKPKSEDHKEKLRQTWFNFSNEKRDAIFKKGIENRRSYEGIDNPFYGKSHSKEFKEWITSYNTEYQNREEIKLNNKLKQPHRIGVDMIDSNTGSVVKSFIGLREAANWIKENTKYKGDVSTISKAVNSGRLSYGYKWIKNN